MARVDGAGVLIYALGVTGRLRAETAFGVERRDQGDVISVA